MRRGAGLSALLALALLALAPGCSGDLTPVQGTAIRIGTPQPEKGTELTLHIFTNEGECLNAAPGDVADCLPHVDRASGEVRLGFEFKLDSGRYALPLAAENLRVVHQGTEIQDGQNGQAYAIIPHEPTSTNQLYIVVIDGSSSMNDNGRMDKVRQALLMKEVKEAFFPGENVHTGVVLLTFTDDLPEPVGGTLKVIDTPEEYVKTVKTQLRVLNGYTHLFDAVRYATGDLLKVKEINSFLDNYQAAPTAIVLTDGFNDLAAPDTCADNAARLSTLIKHLQKARQTDVDIRRRPTVFTVGLGSPLRPRFALPTTVSADVTPDKLCGKYANRRIDGDLEKVGIDNASLSWIADMGGGTSYVRRNRDGLAEAFRAAAATRYYWFEVRYRVDPFYLRRSFRTRLRLLNFANAEASVEIFPSAWLDAPPGVPRADGWVVPRPFLHTATVAVPTLAMLVALSYLGAALYNTRRALFRRATPPRRPPPPRAPPPAR